MRNEIFHQAKGNKLKAISILTIVFVLLCAGSPAGAAAADNSAPEIHYTYVIVHGASGGGWDWRTMDELLTAGGHTVFRPTLTGLGEKMHLANADINLTTHINDIVNVILFEDLNDIVLAGHSYGGFVITGVMNRVPERIRHAVFLDAGVPEDGMSAEDLWGLDNLVDHVIDGQAYFVWLDSSTEYPRDVPQSLKTLTEPVAFNNPAAIKLPATYVAFLDSGQTAEARAEDASWKTARERGWTIRTLESDHNAQRSHPEELKTLLIDAPNDRNKDCCPE